MTGLGGFLDSRTLLKETGREFRVNRASIRLSRSFLTGTWTLRV